MSTRFCPKLIPAAMALSCIACFAVTSRASDDLSETALAVAPQDVSFFSTSVNLKDSWQDFANSRVVTRMRAVPYIQKLESELLAQWNSPPPQLQQAKAIYESPMAQNVLRFFGDIFSDEAFVYGEADWNEAMASLIGFNNAMSYSMSQGPDAMEGFLEEQLPIELAKIQIPTTVMGFRLEDKQNALYQLNALEAIIRASSTQVPELAKAIENFKHTDLEDGTTLTLKLDASLVPVDELDEDQRALFEKIEEALAGRGVTISLGVRDGFFLLAISESETVLGEVGSAEKTLLEHTAVNVLKEAAPERLRAINYSSAEFRNAAWQANMQNYFSRMSSQLTGALRSELDDEPELAKEWIAEIEADATRLDEMIAKNAPDYGATLSWQFATDAGAEGYVYDWTLPSALENGAPLDVVNHSGSRPLVSFSFMQAGDSAEAKEMVEYLIDAVDRHSTRFVEMAERDEDDKEAAKMVLERSLSLVGETFDIVESKIAPSLDERQSVFSIASQLTVDNLGGQPLPGPLPVPEMALACKVTNQELFLSGCADLLTVFDGIVDLIREVNPGGIPAEYNVPRPQEETIQGGRRFFYTEFANAIPVPGINPQIAVNNDVVVFGYSQRQVDDMLNSRQTNVSPAWVIPTDEVAAVSYIDMAGIVNMIRPWAQTGLQMNLGSLDTPVAQGDGPIPTGNDILAIWDCLTSLGKVAGSAEVTDEGVVTRWVWIEQ
ncbi:MAG: hypothetical protein Aurels2KO_52180 [Aureliella sp.]